MKRVKTLVALGLVCSLIFSGCGSKTTTIDLTGTVKPETEAAETRSTEAEATEASKEESSISLFDKDVEVVLSMYSFDDTTVEDYIAKLQQENPDQVYAVYDDSHYTQTIKESERKAILEAVSGEEYVTEAFQDIFSDEQYGGAFVSMEYDDLFQHITFYADKTAYESAGFAAIFGPILIGGMFGDFVQAYSLVPVEERFVVIQIIDNQTGDVLYDSSAE